MKHLKLFEEFTNEAANEKKYPKLQIWCLIEDTTEHSAQGNLTTLDDYEFIVANSATDEPSGRAYDTLGVTEIKLSPADKYVVFFPDDDYVIFASEKASSAKQAADEAIESLKLDEPREVYVFDIKTGEAIEIE